MRTTKKIMWKASTGMVCFALSIISARSAELASESVIKQTFVPQAMPEPQYSNGFDPCAQYGYGPTCAKKEPDMVSIQCKILSVGADKPELVTVALKGFPHSPPEAYSNGVCRKGMFARHTMIRVASGAPQYKWIGAWCQPWPNTVQIWENGQISSCYTSRSWLDLSPGRQTASMDAEVEMDIYGKIVAISNPQ